MYTSDFPWNKNETPLTSNALEIECFEVDMILPTLPFAGVVSSKIDPYFSKIVAVLDILP